MLLLITALTAPVSAAVQLRHGGVGIYGKEPLKTLLQSCALLLSFFRGPLLSEEADRHCSQTVCVCPCVFWFFGDSASPLRSRESEAAGAADAHRLFTRRGGQRGRERARDNSGEITGRLHRSADQRQADESGSSTVAAGSRGTGTRWCSNSLGVRGVCEYGVFQVKKNNMEKCSDGLNSCFFFVFCLISLGLLQRSFLCGISSRESSAPQVCRSESFYSLMIS